jgi:streptomycin 6-kinase
MDPNGLEKTAALFAEKWSLAFGEVFTSQSRNYVVAATQFSGIPAVLKIGRPHPDIERETEALRLFAGNGAVTLLKADVEGGAILTERALPGAALSNSTDDEMVISAAAQVMRRLLRPAPPTVSLPSVTRWLTFLQNEQQPFFPDLIKKSLAIILELLQSDSGSVLLHGDLNPSNIVAAERESWLAIDPKGEIGDPASEPSPWFYNIPNELLQTHGLHKVIDRRVSQFAEELGLDRWRIRAWGFVDAVLSACWMIEDHENGWDWPINCARALAVAL